MLHIMQTRNGTRASDIVAMLRWAEASLPGRFLAVGGGKRLFDTYFPKMALPYEVEGKERMRPLRFAVFAADDAEAIAGASPAEVETVEVVSAAPAHVTEWLCDDFRRHGVDADDGKLTEAIVASINDGLKGSVYDAVANRLSSSAAPTP